MAEIITVARPYAEAVFRLAKDANRLALVPAEIGEPEAEDREVSAVRSTDFFAGPRGL
jgi:hypothetical protein